MVAVARGAVPSIFGKPGLRGPAIFLVSDFGVLGDPDSKFSRGLRAKDDTTGSELLPSLMSAVPVARVPDAQRGDLRGHERCGRAVRHAQRFGSQQGCPSSPYLSILVMKRIFELVTTFKLEFCWYFFGSHFDKLPTANVQVSDIISNRESKSYDADPR